MSMFQITERKNSIDAACAPEHFDTFFEKNRSKIEGVPAKKRFCAKRSLTPSIFIKTAFLSFCISYFSDFGV